MYKACIIVLSDREYTGEEEDSVGRKIEKFIKKNNFEILVYKIIPEVKSIYRDFLIKCCDNYCVDLVLTIGNRKLSQEVVQEVIEEKELKFDSYRRKKTIIKNLDDDINENKIDLNELVNIIKKL